MPYLLQQYLEIQIWHTCCREVCGFPTIVHGGFTATVMDETLGFLLFALKKQKALPFWGPAYTAHLEVEYKAVSCWASACHSDCQLLQTDLQGYADTYTHNEHQMPVLTLHVQLVSFARWDLAHILQPCMAFQM